MSKVNDFGFSESNGDEVGITMSTPFLESDNSNTQSISGRIGSNNNNNNSKNSGGIGSGGGININGDPYGNSSSGGGSKTSNNFGSGTIAFMKGLTHPVAASVHVLFKLSAILLYLFSGLFGGGFILTFILCILLLSFDFYSVKNITGRLLVGLRWWNQVDPKDGSNKWYFETAPEGHRVNQIESLIFWITLYGTPIFWILFFLKCIISLQFAWILIPIIALSLNMANVYGFYKCSNSNVSNAAATFASNYIGRSLLQRASSFM
ncbi:hypothetical protein ACTFIR_011572 [Dictyostelium discoideum]